MTKILIGVDGSERSDDAVAFGRALALAADAPVTLAMAHRSEPLRPGAEEHDAFLRDDAERTLVRLAAALDDVRDLELRPLVVEHVARACPPSDRGAGARRHHRGRLKPHRPAGTGAAGEHRRATAARRALSGRGRAAWLPKPRDTLASGGRLRLLPDGGRRGRAWRRRGTRPRAIAPLRVMQVIEPLAQLYDGGEMPFNSLRSTHRSSRHGTALVRARRAPQLQTGI